MKRDDSSGEMVESITSPGCVTHRSETGCVPSCGTANSIGRSIRSGGKWRESSDTKNDDQQTGHPGVMSDRQPALSAIRDLSILGRLGDPTVRNAAPSFDKDDPTGDNARLS